MSLTTLTNYEKLSSNAGFQILLHAIVTLFLALLAPRLWRIVSTHLLLNTHIIIISQHCC